ncbi:MAG: hypothetical protein FWG45_01435 [Oscillospiraceae bacterium]|nr:hypothetical protein [Oscillospiraceae bacterium]
MKKRFLSLLLAMVMIVTIIPVVTVPVSANPNSHTVRIAAASAENWDIHWLSEPIVITGARNEPYKGKITFPSDTPIHTLTKLAIISDIDFVQPKKPMEESNYGWELAAWMGGDDYMFASNPEDFLAKFDPSKGVGADPRVDTSWKDYSLTIGNITFNGNVSSTSLYEGFFKNRDKGETVHIKGFTYANLWNAWYSPANTLTGIIPVLGKDMNPPLDSANADAICFNLPGYVPLQTVEVEFYVTNPLDRTNEFPPSTDGAEIYLGARYMGSDTPAFGESQKISADGEYTVDLMFPGSGTQGVTDLAIMSKGGDFSPTKPFIEKATPAPLAWSEGDGVHLKITDVKISGTALAAPATKRWIDICKAQPSTEDERATNSNLVIQKPTYVDDSPFIGYINVPLWNAWHKNSQNLNGGTKVAIGEDIDPDVNKQDHAYGASLGNVTSISVTFTVSGIGSPAQINCTCWKCTGISAKGTGKIVQDRTSDKPQMADALQLLRFVVKLSSEISTGGKGSPAWNAALIETDADGTPGMADALQVLRYVVKLSHKLVDENGNPISF